MPLRTILLSVLAGTCLSLLGLVLVLFLLTPEDLYPWSVLLVYLFAALTTIGASTCIGTLVRVSLHKASVPVRQLMRSFRQGCLLSVLVVLLLLLSHLQLLSTWSFVLLVIGLGFVELFFLTSRSRTS